MSGFISDIEAALSSEGIIAREDVVRWIDATPSSDLSTLSKLSRLTDKGYSRIQPDLGIEVTSNLIRRYLLECIRQNVEDDDEIESGFDAACSLHMWLRHLLGMEGTSSIIAETAKAVTNLFLEREELQYTIETAFLEHALETADLRPYFEHWASDPRLEPAWTNAMAWAEAHPNYMWNMLTRPNPWE